MVVCPAGMRNVFPSLPVENPAYSWLNLRARDKLRDHLILLASYILEIIINT